MKKLSKKNTVNYFVNEHGIEMLELYNGAKKRPTYISLKKAVAILATNDNADAISPVKKHGRDLFEVLHADGKKFTVGETKINAVLNNEDGIVLALHASIDSTKEA